MAHNDSFDEPRFEALYRKLYPDLLRCAEIALRTGGSWYVSVAGRAEEVVQELFAFAWEHQADLWSSASPTGWLYRVLRYKVLELLKEDRFWRKHLIRAAGEMPASPEDDFQQRAEITSILTPEEYEINDGQVEKYESSGITYYIVTNNETCGITWSNGNVEVLIQGDLTVPDLEKMVDSIYWE